MTFNRFSIFRYDIVVGKYRDVPVELYYRIPPFLVEYDNVVLVRDVIIIPGRALHDHKAGFARASGEVHHRGFLDERLQFVQC
jgi:hypothetical protein